jgi:oligopeptide/dipeptide ABC transporter ATP-binding protein
VTAAAPPALLEASGLAKRYTLPGPIFGGSSRALPALRGVSFSIGRGETLGLVGESGSGKTTAGRIVARIVEPDEGRITLGGEDWLALSGAALRRRRRDVQIVFQDPQASLNPRLRIGSQLAEPLLVQRLASGADVGPRVRALLADVGLAAEVAERFPAELSGGQRQRVAIARALATGPRLVVCDEPMSALDVSVAAQIANLLLDLRERAGLSYLFVSHDLAVVGRLADRIAVMYLGVIVEEGSAEAVIRRPLHPYTAALIAAAGGTDARALAGEPPSAIDPPPGCAFHPRCPIARPRCAEETPVLATVEPGRRAACFYPGESG